jgi:hypothetical protein
MSRGADPAGPGIDPNDPTKPWIDSEVPDYRDVPGGGDENTF